jgi:hypothetical protein
VVVGAVVVVVFLIATPPGGGPPDAIESAAIEDLDAPDRVGGGRAGHRQVRPQGPDHAPSNALDADELVDGPKGMTRPVRDYLGGLRASDPWKQHEEPGLGGVQVHDSRQILPSGRSSRPRPEADPDDERDHRPENASPDARIAHGTLSVPAPLELCRPRRRRGRRRASEAQGRAAGC